MNCANHQQVTATAFCRTCGKALCEECKREVRGVVYCEDCIVARLGDAMPATVVQGAPAAAVVPSGPNPVLAALLGAVPFGIGAVYNGQYAKGLIHMVIFVSLIVGASNASGGLEVMFGMAIPFWVIYQIVDAYRTAKARQFGQPLPDPFGINRMLGYPSTETAPVDAAPVSSQSQPPIGPMIMIGLGVLFLLRTMGYLPYSMRGLWGLIVIGIGVYLLLRRPLRNVVGPVAMITVGSLGLLHAFTDIRWNRSWPLILIAVGAAILWQRSSPAMLSSAPVKDDPDEKVNHG